MKTNDDAFLWERRAQLTFLFYTQLEHAPVTVMPFDLVIQYLKCLSKKEFHSLTRTLLRLEHLSPVYWDCVTHGKKVQFHLIKRTVKIKITFSSQHLTAPFCSSRSMSRVLEPSPVLPAHPAYVIHTQQLLIFNFFSTSLISWTCPWWQTSAVWTIISY